MARQASKLLVALSSKILSSKSFISSSSIRQIRHFGSSSSKPAVFIDKHTRVICQGITDKNGTFHTEQAIEYGTNMESKTTKPVVSFIAGLTAPPGRRMGHYDDRY